jgi:hypothetical protein
MPSTAFERHRRRASQTRTPSSPVPEPSTEPPHPKPTIPDTAPTQALTEPLVRASERAKDETPTALNPRGTEAREARTEKQENHLEISPAYKHVL